MPRDYATDAALRPQPKRDGPDHWATPECLIAALVKHILPDLPPAPVWEPAAGDGPLVRAIEAAGYPVIATDIRTGQDFLATAPPLGCGSLITNPPFNQLNSFLGRAVSLLAAPDNHLLVAVLLLRWDALTAQNRPAILRRACRIYVCTWRPRWIAESTTSPRWSFCWAVWLRGHAGPTEPYWIEKLSFEKGGRHDLETGAGT